MKVVSPCPDVVESVPHTLPVVQVVTPVPLNNSEKVVLLPKASNWEDFLDSDVSDHGEDARPFGYHSLVEVDPYFEFGLDFDLGPCHPLTPDIAWLHNASVFGCVGEK